MRHFKHLTARLIPVCFLLQSFSLAALDLGVSWAVFATPEDPYIEVNIEVAAASLSWKKVDSLRFSSAVDLVVMIKDGEKVVNFEKYTLNSPIVEIPCSLLDVKRFAVPNGAYTLEVRAQDAGKAENTDQFSTPLQVSVNGQTQLSELVLLRGFKPDASDHIFTKNGYFLEPLPFNFYDRGALNLAFYAEIYHSSKAVKSNAYTVRYFIEQLKGNGATELVSVGAQRKRPTSIDAVLVQMDIAKLPSGNYKLHVELRNETNELLFSRAVEFQRSNPFLQVTDQDLTEEMLSRQFVQDLDEKTLRYSMKAVSAIAQGSEPETIRGMLKSGDVKQMRFYIFRHFAQKDPNNPELAYRKFLETAGAADKQFFSGFRHGFETDRGRTYMRYGKPDDLIHVEDEPAAPPYEIWVYYNFPKTNQKNVKFLFYNPTLAGEDFVTLHSTARGEINNPRWEVDLYERNAPREVDGDTIDANSRMKSNFNRRARVYFEDF